MLFGLPDTKQTGQNMWRRLKRKEKMLGVQLMFKLGEQPKSPWYVTEACLRDHMPELFSRRDKAVMAIRDELEDIREELALCKMRDNALAARIRDLKNAVASTR